MTSEAAQYHQDLQTALDGLAQARSGEIRKHRDEFRELPNILEFGELPRELVSGVLCDSADFGGGLLVGTNRRVIVVGKKWRGPMSMIDFPYDQISSVESSKGRLLGEINLEISGTRYRIHNIVNHKLDDFAAFLERAMQAARYRIEETGELGSGELTSEEAQYHEALDAALARLAQERSGAVGKHRDEFRELPNILQFGELPGELVPRVNHECDDRVGLMGAMLVGTNRRVIAVGRSIAGKRSDGPLEVLEFPYDQISSVESKTGMMFGEITLDISGTRHKFDNIDKREMNDFPEFIRQQMQAASEVIAEPVQPEQPAEPASNELTPEAQQYIEALTDVLADWASDEKWSSWTEEIRSLHGLAGSILQRDRSDLWELPEQLAEVRVEPSDNSEVALLVRSNLGFRCSSRGEDGSAQWGAIPYNQLLSVEFGTDSNFGVLTLGTDEYSFTFYMDQEVAREYADYARGRMQAAGAGSAEPEQSGQPAAPVNGALTEEQEQYAYALRFFVEREAGYEYWSKWTEWTEVIRSLPRLIDWTTWEFPTDVDEARDGPSEDAAELLLVRTNLRLVFLFRVEDGSLQYVEFPYDQISSIVARPVANQGQLTLETEDTRFVFYMDDDEVDEVANEVREQMQAARDGAVGPAELERKQFVHALLRVSFGLLRRDEEVSSKWADEEVMEALVALDEDKWEMPVQFAEARFRPSDDSAVLLLFRTNLQLVFLYRVEDGSAQFSGCSYDDISSIEAGTHAGYGELTLETGGETFVFYMDQGEARDFADYARAKMQVATAGTAAPAPQAATQAASVADELERLADLRARGLLTDEEFTLAKERLLQ